MKLALVISVEETGFDAVAVRGKWDQGVRMAASLGYAAVELAVRDPATIDHKALHSVIRVSGLAVAAVGTGQAYLKDGLSLTSDDAGIRARTSERIASHARLAAEFGASTIVGLIRGRVTGDRARTDARFVDALKRLLDVVDRGDGRVLVEPINRYETDYLNTIGEVLGVIERVASSRVQVLADTFHMNIEERTIEDALRNCGRRLGHVHVADSNRQAPGFGHLNFARILAVLEEMDYKGYLSAEILPVPDPESAARQTVAHLTSLRVGVNTEEEM
ncbi:MAG: 5-keto-L-gluconate epimerase [bacterium]